MGCNPEPTAEGEPKVGDISERRSVRRLVGGAEAKGRVEVLWVVLRGVGRRGRGCDDSDSCDSSSVP